MITKLQKHGNSQVVVIPKPILDLLGWDKDTLLKVTTPDGKRLVLSKHQPKQST